MQILRGVLFWAFISLTEICSSAKSSPSTLLPLGYDELNATESSTANEDKMTFRPEPQQTLNVNILLSRVAELDSQVAADRREFILKLSEISSKFNALRSENLELRMDRQATQLSIDKLDNRITLVEERWKQNRWQHLPDQYTDLRRESDNLRNKFESQSESLMRLTQETSAQDMKLQQTSESIRRDLRSFRKEFSGYSTMSFVFVQQTYKAINESESRLKERINSAMQRSQNIADRLKNSFERLEDQANLAISRLDLWNTTKQLNQCQNKARDGRQDEKITSLLNGFVKLRKYAVKTYNLTTKLEGMLYDNNRITNSLSDFKQRSSTAMQKLISNIAHLAKTFPSDCSIAYQRGLHLSEVFVILPNYELGEMQSAQCHFTETDGWTVIQNRQKLNVDFNRKWLEYEKGFGDSRGDYWLGLETIHNIVSTGDWKLRIEMWDIDNNFYVALYTSFHIADRDTNYKLMLSGYRGNASDSLSSTSGIGFSAPDFDTDATVVHCARFEEAGWWMRHCHDSNLNGKEPYGIIWYHKPTSDYLTLLRTRMLIAPLRKADLLTSPPPTMPPTSTAAMTSSTPRFRDVSNSYVEVMTTIPAANQSSFEENMNETEIQFPDFENATEVTSFNVSTDETELNSTVLGLKNEYEVENMTYVTSSMRMMNSNVTENRPMSSAKNYPSTAPQKLNGTASAHEKPPLNQGFVYDSTAPAYESFRGTRTSLSDSTLSSSIIDRQTATESTPESESSTRARTTNTELALNTSVRPTQSALVKRPIVMDELSRDNTTSFKRLPELTRSENISDATVPDSENATNVGDLKIRKTIASTKAKHADDNTFATIRENSGSASLLSDTTPTSRPMETPFPSKKSSKNKKHRKPKETIVKKIEEAWQRKLKQANVPKGTK